MPSNSFWPTKIIRTGGTIFRVGGWTGNSTARITGFHFSGESTTMPWGGQYDWHAGGINPFSTDDSGQGVERTDVFRIDEISNLEVDEEAAAALFQQLIELKKNRTKFDIRIYDGPKTYFQVSLNNDNMALVIAENPVTATWITREFNPDLIDNAVKAFDRDWKKSRSFLELSPKDLEAFGVRPNALISRIRPVKRGE